MSSIYLPAELKSRLVRAARRRGYHVDRGRQSQLTEYIDYLVQLDERTGRTVPRRRTVDRAVGLIKLAGQPPPTDADLERLLDERRMGA